MPSKSHHHALALVGASRRRGAAATAARLRGADARVRIQVVAVKQVEIIHKQEFVADGLGARARAARERALRGRGGQQLQHRLELVERRRAINVAQLMAHARHNLRGAERHVRHALRGRNDEHLARARAARRVESRAQTGNRREYPVGERVKQNARLSANRMLDGRYLDEGNQCERARGRARNAVECSGVLRQRRLRPGLW